MRNMSFMLTTRQVRARSKDVTRRNGWRTLQPGQLLCAVEKCMGLKAGEKINRLTTIPVLEVRFEQLRRMTDDPAYGRRECAREGFGDDATLHEPLAFVDFFCRSHRGCMPDTEITRIEFEYVEAT
jgi:hypothetical protein